MKNNIQPQPVIFEEESSFAFSEAELLEIFHDVVIKEPGGHYVGMSGPNKELVQLLRPTPQQLAIWRSSKNLGALAAHMVDDLKNHPKIEDITKTYAASPWGMHRHPRHLPDMKPAPESLYLPSQAAFLYRIKLQFFKRELLQKVQHNDEKEAKTYTQNHTATLDINRAISGEPKCFVKIVETPKKGRSTRKVIVNVSSRNILSSSGPFAEMCARCGLDFYTLNRQGEIVPISQRNDTFLWPSRKIKETLLGQQKNLDDYFILDAYEMNQLINATTLNDNRYIADFIDHYRSLMYVIIPRTPNDMQETLKIIRDSRLEENLIVSVGCKQDVSFMHKMLCHLRKLKQLTVATLHGNDGSQWTVTLPNMLTNLEQLNVCGRGIVAIKLSDRLPNVSEMNLYHCEDLTTLDLTGAANLKVVKVFGANKLKSIKVNANQKSIIFDFKEAFINSPQTAHLVESLKAENWTVHHDAYTLPEERLSIQPAKLPSTPTTQEQKSSDKFYRRRPVKMRQKTRAGGARCTQRRLLLNHEGNIAPRDYRMSVLTKVCMDQKNEELLFMPFQADAHNIEPINIKKLEKMPNNAFTQAEAIRLNKANPGSFFGVISLPVNGDQWLPLAALTADDRLTLLDSDSMKYAQSLGLKLEIGYAKETQQYFARLTQSSSVQDRRLTKQPTSLYVYYGMSPKTHPLDSKPVLAHNPTMLNKAIDAILPENHTFEPKQELKKTIEAMRTFGSNKRLDPFRGIKGLCRRFEEKEITPAVKTYVNQCLEKAGIDNESITFVITCLCAQAGACTHRARIFFILANYLKIPSRVITNDCHEYVEYLQHGRWIISDLGGGRVDEMTTLDVWDKAKSVPSPLEIRSAPTEQEEKSPKLSKFEQQMIKTQKKSTTIEAKPKPSPLVITSAPTEQEKKSPKLAKFEQHFTQKPTIISEERGFANWYQDLLALKKHPLLEFEHDSEAYLLHQNMMALAGNKLGSNYFYIHRPADFDVLLRQLIVKKTGECFQEKGPLLTMIERKSGLIFINWSHFDERQIATYKSMLDCRPTLQGYPLAAGIKVIGIVKKNTNACSAFYSRTCLVAFPKMHPMVVEKACQDEKANGEIVVDLYGSDDWESILIGKLQIKGDHFAFVEGALVQASKKNMRSITLTGLPAHSKFKDFIDRVTIEKGFYANGSWRPLPAQFSFHFQPLHHKAFVPKPVPTDQHGMTYYINKQNYEMLFSRYTIDQEGRASHLKGMLEEMPEPATIILTDELCDGRYRRLESAMKKHGPNIQLMTVQKTPCMGTISSQNEHHIQALKSLVIITDDVNAVERRLALKVDAVVDISETTEYSDLFNKISLKESKSEAIFSKKHLRFRHDKLDVMKQLSAGKCVVLKGHITSELYHQIETLFHKTPYLMVNGQYQTIPGKVVLITPANPDSPTLFNSAANHFKHQFSWESATKYVRNKLSITTSESKQCVPRIKAFFDAIKEIKHDGINTPPELVVTEDKVLAFANAMKQTKAHNPVKDIFCMNYAGCHEIYARVCVMAKRHLSEAQDDGDIDHDQLKMLLESMTGSVDAVKWQILNCCSPSYLRKHPNIMATLPASPEAIRKVFGSLQAIKKTTQLPHATLVKNALKRFPFVELRGEPGTGKTHFLKHEIINNGIEYYWGDKGILPWLKSTTASRHRPAILLLDEANMRRPGHWEFLRGLMRHDIYYKGVRYKLSLNSHQVIFTGNPENYPGRHYHALLQEVPKIHFESPQRDFLEHKVVMPLLTEEKTMTGVNEQMREKMAKQFVQAYFHVKAKLPYETVSIRDLKCMVEHLRTLMVRTGRTLMDKMVCTTIVQTFAGLFRSGEKRNAFVDWLKRSYKTETIDLLTLPDAARGYMLPSTRQLLWHNVNQCLRRRELAVAHEKTLTRSGFLVEGPSGIGKSEMMLQALHDNHYKPVSEAKGNDQKIYYHITMGTENISDVVAEAYKKGAVVVIDELNLLTKKDEDLLTGFLEGRDSNGLSSSKGFFVLASQNSQLYAGRRLLSRALLNRLDRYYECQYSRDDLLEICVKSKAFVCDADQEKFVDCFLKSRQSSPNNINLRNFFEAISAEKQAVLQHSI